MKTIVDPLLLQNQCLAWRGEGKSIAVVPTMGFFHAGHESLMRQARTLADKLVVTLFVNPSQFGPGEDLGAYPRKLEQDAAIAQGHGADVLFTPAAEEMYAPGHSTWVEVGGVSQGLCGASRPGHFRGVTTVVAKLFSLCQPTVAVFGEKDWQQLAVIRRMVRDLFLPVSIVGMPIFREADGLAMSSRNAYLTPAERAEAVHISHGVFLARKLALQGASIPEVKAGVLTYWNTHLPLGSLDYLQFVHPETMQPVENFSTPVLVAVAMKVGKARLIDNCLIAPVA
ncbi:pantoate--beta-alanine ligase [Desulfovibrio cuneatus]|uniref:pantoate--beta-alanine ligase n=1 Tax=Desulfovibrio cuneatus TaxID=159728 RepID=UPI0003FC6811|nr:pantoate--beta-alanine ligase [Desulfovibrio cuneatus]